MVEQTLTSGSKPVDTKSGITRRMFLKVSAEVQFQECPVDSGPRTGGSACATNHPSRRSAGVVGASPFPRHWIHDAAGDLAAKSGAIDWSTWTKEHDHARSPWHDVQVESLVVDVESEVERLVSRGVMKERRGIHKLAEGAELTVQGESGDEIYLILDGVFDVEVDGATVAEIGPGAIVGERAVLEGGVRTSTVRARTAAKVAAASADGVHRDALEEIAETHDRETV